MNSRRRFLHASAAAFASVAASRAHADDPTDRLLESVASARAAVTTLVASFVQTRRIALLATDVISHGKMTIVRPDRLRWELLPPEAMTYWVGPEGLSYEGAASKATASRATAGSLGQVMDDLMVVLGGDLRDLRRRYELQASQRAPGLIIRARPRGGELAKMVRRLELELAGDRVRPSSVLVQETETDYVRIGFSGVRLNARVDPATMRPRQRAR